MIFLLHLRSQLQTEGVFCFALLTTAKQTEYERMKQNLHDATNANSIFACKFGNKFPCVR
nr:hypothetical protein [Campylobacter sp.]